MDYWHWWVIAGIGMFILELLVPGFVLGCFGIGALCAALVAVADTSIELQLLVFALTSVISFFAIRPFVLKYLSKTGDYKSNTDSIIGREGEVTKDFDVKLKKGRVKVDGDDWMAFSVESVELKKGDRVRIQRVDSNTIIVSAL